MQLALKFDSKSTYLFRRKIGSGGSAEVFLYLRQTDGLPAQEVALKILKAHSEEHIRELLNEGRRLGSLRHPNILTTFGYEKIDQTNFGLVLEYFPGENLKSLVPRLPAEHRAAVAEYVIKIICEAVALAHSQGIVHGDLSGRNVLVSEQGQIKLSDFGLARRTNPDGAVARNRVDNFKIKGSADYMAPELWRGQIPSASSDVFSIGILAAEILLGHNPLIPAESATIDPRSPRSPSTPRTLDEGAERVSEFLNSGSWIGFSEWREFFKGCLLQNPDQRVSARDLATRVPRFFPATAEIQKTIAGAVKSRESAPGQIHSRTHTHFFPRATPKAGAPNGITERIRALSPVLLVPLAPVFFAAVVFLSAAARPDDGFSERRRPCFLTLTSRPWGELWVDGISRGYTPFINLPIAAGFHRLTWRDPFGREYTKTLMAFENGTLAYKISREKDGRLVGAPLEITGRRFGSPR